MSINNSNKNYIVNSERKVQVSETLGSTKIGSLFIFKSKLDVGYLTGPHLKLQAIVNDSASNNLVKNTFNQSHE